MRFVIYGAGGIGGTVGARLHQAGHDVLLIARGAHLEAIRANGLRFITPSQDVTLPIPAAGHPGEAGLSADDVVILCMKSQHTEMALRDLYGHANDATPVVCCQNGVANERMALRRFQNVYGMVVFLPAEHLEPGVVVNFAEDSAGMLDTGRYPIGTDATAEAITAAIDSSGFSARPDERIMRQKYAKLLANLNNAVQAACGEGSKSLSAMLRDEALACYAAAGIDCQSAEEVRSRRLEGINSQAVPGHERHGGSSLQSVMRGTGDIEADYLNGEIVQLGRLHDVPTPANAVVQRIGNRVVREGLAVGAYAVDELLELVEAER